MITRLIAVAALATVGAFSANAQTINAADVPTEAQCKEGYKAGGALTQEQFEAECKKVLTNAKGTGYDK
ncbi:MAG: hypothetical protein AAFR55_00310 [Pseudomonadota bacterium]